MRHSCYRCDRYHDPVCELCAFVPGCADHNCWSTAHLQALLDELRDEGKGE